MTINQELLEVFKKNLPEHANQSIVAVFEENKQLESNLQFLKKREEELLEKVKSKEKLLAAATAENKKLQALVKKEEDLELEAGRIENEKRELKYKLLEAKYEALSSSKEEIKDLVKAVFRNPVLKKSASVPVAETNTWFEDNVYNSTTGQYETRKRIDTVVTNYDETTKEEII